MPTVQVTTEVKVKTRTDTEIEYETHVKKQREIAEKIREQELVKSKKIEATLEKVNSEFKKHCEISAGYLPPNMTKSEEHRVFREFIQKLPPNEDNARILLSQGNTVIGGPIFGEAVRRFIERYDELEFDVQVRLREVRSRLARAKFAFSKRTRILASQVHVSFEPPELSLEQRESFDRNIKYISSQRDESDVALAVQGSISIVKDEDHGQSHVQLCSPDFGCVYLTVPSNLNPTEVAYDVMRTLAGSLSSALGGSDPIIMLNGDAQEINMKRILKNNIILKTSSNTTEKLFEVSFRVKEIYGRAPLSPTNTRVISGLPRSPQELEAVFSDADDSADWALWQDIAAEWSNESERASFPLHSDRTSENFLSALEEEENVIVLVAHAKTNAIYFPDGSMVTPENILTIQDTISKNRPSVYLFCCETAQYDEAIVSIKDALLQAGASTVVAPQIQIAASTSRKLFKNFLKFGISEIPILALRIAEQKSKNRDLETWVG